MATLLRQPAFADRACFDTGIRVRRDVATSDGDRKDCDHTLTNAGVVQRFLNVSIAIDAESRDVYRITVRSR